MAMGEPYLTGIVLFFRNMSCDMIHFPDGSGAAEFTILHKNRLTFRNIS